MDIQKKETPHTDYYLYLPKKPMAAAALFLDEEKRILLVKPIDGEKWSVSGGVVEKNESPRKACVREIKEELSLDINVDRLLCLQYIFAADREMETLQFLFWGGVLTKEQINHIKLQESELTDFKFMEFSEAICLAGITLKNRLQNGWDALEKKSGTIYFEEYL